MNIGAILTHNPLLLFTSWRGLFLTEGRVFCALKFMSCCILPPNFYFHHLPAFGHSVNQNRELHRCGVIFCNEKFGNAFPNNTVFMNRCVANSTVHRCHMTPVCREARKLVRIVNQRRLINPTTVALCRNWMRICVQIQLQIWVVHFSRNKKKEI